MRSLIKSKKTIITLLLFTIIISTITQFYNLPVYADTYYLPNVSAYNIYAITHTKDNKMPHSSDSPTPAVPTDITDIIDDNNSSDNINNTDSNVHTDTIDNTANNIHADNIESTANDIYVNSTNNIDDNTIETNTVDSSTPDIVAPSAILMEASSGIVIYEKEADSLLHPASITKIMTLILIFDAIAEGKITLEDEVTVSEYAASMGGSQVFLEPGEVQTVDTMIKCIAVASANDACVAMAEYISGSEELFVEKMNERAKGLGMLNTTFHNCCGLDVEGHMTTARDVAYMSRELVTKYPEIHDYSTIWMDTIIHSTRRGNSEFGLSNTNKLLKQYEWATGLKTGSTSLAKFCLSATALKNDIELIAVVMCAPDGKQRVADCISLLNYGYGVCSKYEDSNPPALEPVPIKGGVVPDINCGYKNTFSYLFLSSYDATQITCHLEMLTNIGAPVSKGDTLGMLVYEYGGKTIGSIDVVALEDVKKAEYGDYVEKVLGEFFNN